MKISQLSNTKVLISLCSEDMKSFELEFDNMSFSDPHSKKIISRLLNLARTSGSIDSSNKTILCEALKSDDGCVLLVSFNEDNNTRKKYRIKRIREYPCYRFLCAEDLLTAIEKLYSTDLFFYNNSAYLYNDCYYLVFDYPVVARKTHKILSEYGTAVKGTKPFVARLHESALALSQGNAIVHIGTSL